jgi:hypothetical protein
MIRSPGPRAARLVANKRQRLERIRAAKAALDVAQGLTTHGSDQDGLVPLLDATAAARRRTHPEASADAGFCREDNLEALAGRSLRGYLAPGGGWRMVVIALLG